MERGFCCALGSSAKPKAGWPPLEVYAFGGCGDRLQPGAVLLAGGTDPAYYHRQVNAGYQVDGGSLGCCRPDQDRVRQHYLSLLFFASAEARSDAYRGELAAVIAEQQRVFAEPVRRLGKQALLSGEDAQTLRPALRVRVWDRRASREPALPTVPTVAENVTVEPF